jgi:hypothetical protein
VAIKKFKHAEASLEGEFLRVYDLLTQREPHRGATAPDKPSFGRMWYDTSDGGEWKVYNGATWDTLN